MKLKIDRETLGRTVFLVVALIVLVMNLLKAGLIALPGSMVTLGLAFIFIWFGDELGAYTGFAHMWKVTPTPGVLIKIAGWILLTYSLAVAVLLLFR